MWQVGLAGVQLGSSVWLTLQGLVGVSWLLEACMSSFEALWTLLCAALALVGSLFALATIWRTESEWILFCYVIPTLIAFLGIARSIVYAGFLELACLSEPGGLGCGEAVLLGDDELYYFAPGFVAPANLTVQVARTSVSSLLSANWTQEAPVSSLISPLCRLSNYPAPVVLLVVFEALFMISVLALCQQWNHNGVRIRRNLSRKSTRYSSPASSIAPLMKLSIGDAELEEGRPQREERRLIDSSTRRFPYSRRFLLYRILCCSHCISFLLCDHLHIIHTFRISLPLSYELLPLISSPLVGASQGREIWFCPSELCMHSCKVCEMTRDRDSDLSLPQDGEVLESKRAMQMRRGREKMEISVSCRS